MSFLPQHPPEHEETADEPGVMHIGGARSKKFWQFVKWATVLSAIGGAMAAMFIRFGATTLWACGLVIFMFGYMAIMSHWAGGSGKK